ncbi:MAG: anti-sigma factor [Stackebrandtia sp.]
MPDTEEPDDKRQPREAPKSPTPRIIVEQVDAPRIRLRGRRLFATVAVAAVAMIAVGSISTFAIMRNQMADVEAASHQVTTVWEQPDAHYSRQEVTGGGQVSIVSSRRHNDAVVAMSRLPKLPDDEVYQLWLVSSKRSLSAAVLPAGETTATRVVSGLSQADRITLTREPDGGEPSPSSPPVVDIGIPE